LYVRSCYENRVYESLKEISLEPFLPKVKIVRQWHDRKKTIDKPLFPSYVFVKINSSSEFYKVLSVFGVCGYIRFGKEYARITQKEKNQLELLVGDKNIIDIEVNNNTFKVGEIKTITNGPLRGLECRVIKINNKKKIIVRIDSLKQDIIATLSAYFFES
jgi:transcription antitermination factor NusG